LSRFAKPHLHTNLSPIIETCKALGRISEFTVQSSYSHIILTFTGRFADLPCLSACFVAPGEVKLGCLLMQCVIIQSNTDVFEQVRAPVRVAARPAQRANNPKKSQLGRWKGMDEDQSDDQVCLNLLQSRQLLATADRRLQSLPRLDKHRSADLGLF